MIVEHLPYEHRKHKPRFAVFQLVVRTELTERAQLVAPLHSAAHKSFRYGYGQYVRLSRKPVYFNVKLVKAFPEHLVRENRVGSDCAADIYPVVFFGYIVHHIPLKYLYFI